jgi:hypothetical protein
MRPKQFKPARMSELAFWFADGDDSLLVVVIPPQQQRLALDDVFAQALAWQHDRDLIFVVPRGLASDILVRLPWIATPCRVLTYDEVLLPPAEVIPARDEVLTQYALLGYGTVTAHTIPDEQRSWVAALLQDEALAGCEEVPTAGYVSWHHHGLQVLQLTSGRKSLRVAAGIQYSGRGSESSFHTNELITGPMTDSQVRTAIAVIRSDRDSGSVTTQPAEHRLQAAISRTPMSTLGLGVRPQLRREFPGWRAPGRKGYIDFLGIDAADHLHVVETKIGHDAAVVLQALDYSIWVQANEEAIRTSQGWPKAPEDSTVHLDLVLASKVIASTGRVKDPAVNPYLPGVLEALAGDIRVRVFFIPDATVDEIELQPLGRAELWEPVPGRVAKAVRPARWSARVDKTLRDRPAVPETDN